MASAPTVGRKSIPNAWSVCRMRRSVLTANRPRRPAPGANDLAPLRGIPLVKLRVARRDDIIMAALAVVVFIVDQLTKSWIVGYFQLPGLKAPVPILGQLLELDYIQN